MAKHYAIADIHGMFDIYIQVCDMLQPDDVVYFLGDAGDRGYDGFHCINYIYSDPQWIYLKGNHEDMFVHAARYLLNNLPMNGLSEISPLMNKKLLKGLSISKRASFKETS